MNPQLQAAFKRAFFSEAILSVLKDYWEKLSVPHSQ